MLLRFWPAACVLVALCLCSPLDACADRTVKDDKPALALRASLAPLVFENGDEITAAVEIVNVSDKPVQLKYMKPYFAVPEIYDLPTNKRLLNAPSYVYDQIVVPQDYLLKPKETISLMPLPILIGRSPVGAARNRNPGYTRAYWDSKPGKYALKFSVSQKDFLVSGTGTLTANSLEVTVKPSSFRTVEKIESGSKQQVVSGILGFESGRGYFVKQDKFSSPRVWVLISENKVFVRQLEGMAGKRVRLTGELKYMPANVTAVVPPGGAYMSDFEISEF